MWKCFPRTLIIDPNIRNHFSIIVLTYNPSPPKKKKQNKTKQKQKQETKQTLL